MSDAQLRNGVVAAAVAWWPTSALAYGTGGVEIYPSLACVLAVAVFAGAALPAFARGRGLAAAVTLAIAAPLLAIAAGVAGVVGALLSYSRLDGDTYMAVMLFGPGALAALVAGGVHAVPALAAGKPRIALSLAFGPLIGVAVVTAGLMGLLWLT